jgi:hypothetical protein
MVEVIPLPEALLHCGCPNAANGRHLTTCIPAREHSVIPLRDRPEYVEGARFRAISWDYPLHISTRISVTVDIDPIAYIAAHQAEYDQFEMDSTYQEWERPMCFIASIIEEAAGDLDMRFGFPSHICRTDSYVDDVDEYPQWTSEDTEQLDLALGRVLPAEATPPEPTLFDA